MYTDIVWSLLFPFRHLLVFKCYPTTTSNNHSTGLLDIHDGLRCTSAEMGFPYEQPKIVKTMYCQQYSAHKTQLPLPTTKSK